MWGDQPPATARDMVRLYVSRARGRIGDSLVREANGYLLRAENGAVDVSELERLRRAGTDALAAGDAAAAVAHLSAAVELVRGEPLAEFAEFPFAREEIPRLEELRLGTTEDYYETLLTTGEAAELVPALEQLVEENPYRERLRGQLMLALYRAGRQTDALARYQEGRRLLAEEVGIEPSPQLRELERAILQHDVDPAPIRRKNGDGAPKAEPRRRPQHRSRWLAALVALLAMGVGVGAFVLTQSGGSGPTLLERNSVGIVDPSSGQVERSVRLPGLPVDLTGSASRVWVATGEPHKLVEIDPNGTVVKPIGLGFVPRRVGPAAGGVWVDDSYSGKIVRIDAAKGAPGKPEQVFGRTRISFARGNETLWVAGGDQSGVAARVDPRTGRVAAARVRGLDAPIAIATGFGALWLAAANRAEIQSVRGNTETPIPIGSLPVAIATGSGAVWAVSPSTGKLWRIDPKGPSVKGVILVGPDPTSVAVGGGSVWVGSDHRHTLLRISPHKGRIVQRIPLGRPVTALSYYDGRLWVAAA
jgi:DNA-binding SARP family transcriptional activator